MERTARGDLARERRSDIVRIPSQPPAFVVRVVDWVRGALDSLRRKLAPPPVVMLELLTGYIVPRAIYVISKLGVADLLADGPQSVRQLAAATKSDAHALGRMMRALASVDVFEELGDGRFAMTPLAATLRSGAPGRMRDWSLITGSPFHWGPWGEVMQSMGDGEPAFEKLFGMNYFQHTSTNAEESRIFDGAMTGFSEMTAPGVAKGYAFKGIDTLVDVGGGNGKLLSAILQAHPRMRGVLLDLPHVVTGAPAMLAAHGVTDRCSIVAGNFFESVPSSGDGYILKNIIHDWNDERSTAILKNIRSVIRPGGKLLLVELVIPPGNGPFFGKLLDLEMLLFTTGGYERNEAEYRDLLAGAGFRMMRIIRTPGPFGVIEAVPVP